MARFFHGIDRGILGFFSLPVWKMASAERQFSVSLTFTTRLPCEIATVEIPTFSPTTMVPVRSFTTTTAGISTFTSGLVIIANKLSYTRRIDVIGNLYSDRARIFGNRTGRIQHIDRIAYFLCRGKIIISQAKCYISLACDQINKCGYFFFFHCRPCGNTADGLMVHSIPMRPCRLHRIRPTTKALRLPHTPGHQGR